MGYEVHSSGGGHTSRGRVTNLPRGGYWLGIGGANGRDWRYSSGTAENLHHRLPHQRKHLGIGETWGLCGKWTSRTVHGGVNDDVDPTGKPSLFRRIR